MENEKKIDELQSKLEELYTERKNVENTIFRLEEKSDIRELSETDARHRNMEYLTERYSALDIEIQKIKDEIEQLKNSQKESPLQKREKELSSLEVEERTIAETEALIDKQTEKEGKYIGE